MHWDESINEIRQVIAEEKPVMLIGPEIHNGEGQHLQERNESRGHAASGFHDGNNEHKAKFKTFEASCSEEFIYLCT